MEAAELAPGKGEEWVRREESYGYELWAVSYELWGMSYEL